MPMKFFFFLGYFSLKHTITFPIVELFENLLYMYIINRMTDIPTNQIIYI